MEQLPLDLRLHAAKGRDDFIVSSCNEIAAALVESWPSWPGQIRAINITGASFSGKTHLGAVWQNMSNAKYLDYVDSQTLLHLGDHVHFVLDDVSPGPAWDEEQLFLLLNRVKDNDGSVMILSATPISQMDWRLPDLRSRLRAVTLAVIGPPDDALLATLMEKYFADRQLAVPETVLHYVLPRIERSFLAVSRLVEQIDRQALANKKKVSLGLVRDVLTQQTDREEK